MNLQEIFDKVATHLLTQNKKAQSPVVPGEQIKPKCLYRAPDGSKCAVGCLIPDDLYDPAIEGSSVADDIVWEAATGELDYDRAEEFALGDLLTQLQITHDEDEVEYWPNALRCIAEGRHLTLPPLLKERLEYVQ